MKRKYIFVVAFKRRVDYLLSNKETVQNQWKEVKLKMVQNERDK